VYIVRCADDTLYTGVSTDVTRRVREHNESDRGAKYTRTRRPVSVAHVEGPLDRGGALRREREVKSLSRAQKLAIIAGGTSG
jgi:putative endonuclease